MEDFLLNNSGVIISLLSGVIAGIFIGSVGTVLYVRSKKRKNKDEQSD